MKRWALDELVVVVFIYTGLKTNIEVKTPFHHQVVVLQPSLFHYRLALFEKMRQACTEAGIEFRLVHGQAPPRELSRKDTGILPWADVVTNRFWSVGSTDVLWQPFPRELRDADLIVVIQQNRVLSNYPLLIKRAFSRTRVAYWGHGKNFQSDAPSGLRERWKNFHLNKVDWWFAYTSITRDILVANGFPENRITVLDNAIDNERFLAEMAEVDQPALTRLRTQLDLLPGAPLGLFCGSLWPDKRLAFMIDAADRIHRVLPDFRLVVIGDGPSAGELRGLIADKSWVHWVGMRKGMEKAGYFKLANVIFNPGTVGLHVLDSFCSGVPMATTKSPRHGPEIVYLEDGINGLVTIAEPQTFADAVLSLLENANHHAALRDAALVAARRYTLDNMTGNFMNGIERCLCMGEK